MNNYFTKKNVIKPLSSKQIEQIINLIIFAGEMAIKFFNEKNFIVKTKADGSKFSCADIEVGNFISTNLSKIIDNFHIICEESSNSLKIAQEKKLKNFWLLDPIDGTNSFLKNSTEFAINLALIINQKPVFGIIYAPAKNFSANFLSYFNQIEIDKANWLKQTFLSKKVKEKINYRNNCQSTTKIITSRRSSAEKIDFFIENYLKNCLNFNQETQFEIVKISSSAKFITLIENEGSIYFNLQNSMIWDTAPGYAIIKAIGGKFFAINNAKKTNKMTKLNYAKCNILLPKNVNEIIILQ